MPAVIAQKIDVVQAIEPVGVVDHERVALAVTEAQEFGEHKLHAGDVRGDLGIAQKLACLVLAGRIADLGRASADQDDRPVPGLLKLPQHHDADQMADMEGRGGAVEADIAGQPLTACQPVQPRLVGRLVDKAPRCQLVQKVRFDGAHGARLKAILTAKPVSALP